MKGYKDTTKTQYITGKSPGPKGAAKAAQTLKAFKKGEAPMKKAEGGRVKVIARGDIPGYDDKSTMKYRKEGPGWRMDPEEFRVMREIDARDRADIEKGKSANASKLDKMAGKEAAERQNRRGWATEGFDEDTGIGLMQPSRRPTSEGRAKSDAVRPASMKKAEGGRVMVRSRGPLIKPNC